MKKRDVMDQNNGTSPLGPGFQPGNTAINNSTRHQLGENSAPMKFTPEELSGTLSLAGSVGDSDLSVKFQALERYGLEEFSTIAAEIANLETDSSQCASAYLAKKRLVLDFRGMENIPTSGPALIVCNHRLGYLDGIIMEYLLSKLRSDRKYLAVNNFGALLGDRIIGVDIAAFAEQRRSAATLETMRDARHSAIRHLQDGGCLCVFPGAGLTTYDPVSGRQSDSPYTAFAYQLEMFRSIDLSIVPVFIDCQFRPLLFEAFKTTDWEFFALQWAEINLISDTTIPVYVGKPSRDRPSNSISHAEQIHASIHHLQDNYESAIFSKRN